MPGFRLKASNTNTTDIDKALLRTLGSKSNNKTGTFPRMAVYPCLKGSIVPQAHRGREGLKIYSKSTPKLSDQVKRTAPSLYGLGVALRSH